MTVDLCLIYDQDRDYMSSFMSRLPSGHKRSLPSSISLAVSMPRVSQIFQTFLPHYASNGFQLSYPDSNFLSRVALSSFALPADVSISIHTSSPGKWLTACPYLSCSHYAHESLFFQAPYLPYYMSNKFY